MTYGFPFGFFCSSFVYCSLHTASNTCIHGHVVTNGLPAAVFQDQGSPEAPTINKQRLDSICDQALQNHL